MLGDQVEHLRTHDGVAVETDLEPDLRVHADPLVDELFRNVLENAVAHNLTDGLTVSVSPRRDGGDAVVVVEDDGDGIDGLIPGDVFDPDVRSPESEGDGLGLYLVRKLVESYDGTITVDDVDPSGTRFTIRVPLA